MINTRCAILALNAEDAALLQSFAFFRGHWKQEETLLYDDLVKLFRDAELNKFQAVIFKTVTEIYEDIPTLVLMLERLRARGIRVLIFDGAFDSADDDTLIDNLVRTIIDDKSSER